MNTDILNEEWRPVKSYEGRYEVSGLGRVRSLDRLDTRGNRIRGKVLRAGRGKHGYLTVALCDGRQRSWTVHDLVAKAFLGSRPPGPSHQTEVNHKDGNKTNNRADNLEYRTNSGNKEHAFDSGLSACGERHYRCVLTREAVEYIRQNVGKETQKAMAKKFGVARTTVADVIHGRTRKRG